MTGITHFYTLENKERKYIASVKSNTDKKAWNIFKKSKYNKYKDTWSNSFFIADTNIFSKQKMIIINDK